MVGINGNKTDSMNKVKKEETGESPKRERGVYARHEVRDPATSNKYGNRLRWDDKAKRYVLVDDPNELRKDN